jgi:hypothetical protein
MPFYFFQDEASRTLYTRVVGEPQSLELVTYYRAMIRRGCIGSGRRELLDGRDITSVAVDLEGQEAMAWLAEENRHFLKHMKSALVASRPAIYGVFRQYQLIASNHQPGLRVYQDMDDALAYLEIPPQEAEENLSRVVPFLPGTPG